MRCVVLALSAVCLWAADPALVPLWPQGAPGWESRPDAENIQKGASGQRAVRNVTHPTLEPFLPAGGGTGAAVIVCPGGGYTALMVDKEGSDAARWLNSLGIAAFVLRYRLIPTPPDGNLSPEERARQRGPHAKVALEDGRRALRMVRQRAQEWKIDPKRVGLMGFSAGGHLAANVAMHFDQGSDSAADPIDRMSSRPDALIAVYPGRFEEASFPSNAPPVFIVHANDDATVPAEYSAELYIAAKKAKVPAELHIYATGGHGFGLIKAGKIVDEWPERLRLWLDAQGWCRR